MPFKPGDPVTVLPPCDNDPLILSMQHYAKVAAASEAGYMIELESTRPLGMTYGPFTADRLAKGWRDRSGRWLAE
jgi:hypothetical protein